MGRTKRMATAAICAIVIVLATLPAGAAPAVAITDVSVAGTTATVTGTAAFTALTDAQSVGGTRTPSALPAASAPVRDAAFGNAGLDLRDGLITPLANGSGLRFTWQVANLLDQGVPPEGVRYTWSFAIAGRLYQLQAKRTNLASVTTAEDPVNHVQQAGGAGFFQLRGACVSSYEGTPAAGCYHLAFLQGGFDTASDTVYMDVPFETRDEIGRLVAPDFRPGAILTPVNDSTTANMSITAAFQAVVGNTNTSYYINDWNPYFVGGVVQVARGSATVNPSTLSYSTATLTGGTFSGTVTGLKAGDHVYARACTGLDCTYTSVPLG